MPALCELVNSPDAIRFQRLIIAEAERQPDLGRAFYFDPGRRAGCRGLS
ncbi:MULTISPECIES: TetR/AcrR family transcriptional regulator C-terminal domain-containing protein [Rhodopseudomonas]